MKRSKLAAFSRAIFLSVAVGGCAHEPAGSSSRSRLPTSLDLPADFAVRESDWVDNERPNAGWFLHINGLRGKAIQERNGVFPIHVMRADMPEFEGNPLLKDDLIVGVNAQPLGKDPVDAFVQEVRRARRSAVPLEVTRWRKGVIETVTLDLAVADQPAIPDLTRGGKPDETRDWALGPLGVNGWGFFRPTGQGGSSLARQLLITLVDETGPAAGKLEVGDVVLGVQGKKFERDARKALAGAINEAETEKGGGQLALVVWRPSPELGTGEGKELEIAITLPVLGTYSRTAPFDCPKTDGIIDNAVAYMVERKDELLKPAEQGWLNYINGLGLLATGREDVMPIVRELAHGSLLKPGETLSVEKHVSMQCWWWSYKTVFLCEYYLRTGDEAVLPTIEEHAIKIAMGQSGAGTWGHTYAARENTGYLHGHLGGYGAINQQGLTLMIALPLAVKCGVDHPEVRDAIQRGDDFFSYFIGKGTIPYGDHGAQPWFDDNGKSGAAAVYFDMVKNDAGREFFSEMILGSAPGGREQGHTGHYWSHLWGGLGAARGGDKALQVFMQEMDTVFTLERQHTGRFAFQDNIGERGDQGKPKAKWDSTGARLLQLCVPRRALYITGKETPARTHLTGRRMEQILRAGRLMVDQEARDGLSTREILALLKDPLSPTRNLAVGILEERELNLVDRLMKMLDSRNRFERYGAAEALGRVGFASQEAADKLIRMMAEDADTQFRVHAVNALDSSDRRLGLAAVAKPAIPVLLRMATETLDDDPRRVLQHDIARVLFYNGRAQPRRGLLAVHGLEDVDKDLLVPAIRAILTNQNGWARSTVTHFIYPLLDDDTLNLLWGDIYRATRHIAPSGIMFASEARTDGLSLMSRHHVEEGMYLAAWYVRWQKGHASNRRIPIALAALANYGAHAKAVVPYLEAHAEHFKAEGSEGKVNDITAAIERINAAEAMPELLRIAAYLNKDDIPPKDGP